MPTTKVKWLDRTAPGERCIVVSGGGASVVIPVGDVWLCDFCNRAIDDLRFIPVVGGYALCRACCRRWYNFDPQREFPAAVED